MRPQQKKAALNYVALRNTHTKPKQSTGWWKYSVVFPKRYFSEEVPSELENAWQPKCDAMSASERCFVLLHGWLGGENNVQERAGKRNLLRGKAGASRSSFALVSKEERITLAPSNSQSRDMVTTVARIIATQSVLSKGWNIFHHDTCNDGEVLFSSRFVCGVPRNFSCEVSAEDLWRCRFSGGSKSSAACRTTRTLSCFADSFFNHNAPIYTIDSGVTNTSPADDLKAREYDSG